MEASSGFGVNETHGILWRPGAKIAASSDGRGWNSIYASLQDEAPYADSYAAVPDHLLILHLSGPVSVTRRVEQTECRRVVPMGGLFLMPGGTDFKVELENPLSSLHIYVRGSILQEVAEQSDIPTSSLELVPRLGEQDPLLENLALGVKGALQGDDTASRMYVEHLSYALAAHLLRKHSSVTAAPPSPEAPGLSKQQLQRAIDVMEAKLDAPLLLTEVAAACDLSPSHFARRFKAATGLPPHQYLISLRVERAKRLLKQSKPSIAEIAYICGFTHQEHLTRIFRRATGTTPAFYRRNALS